MSLLLLALPLSIAVPSPQDARGPQPALPHFEDVKAPATPRSIPPASATAPRPASPSDAVARAGATLPPRTVARDIDRVWIDRAAPGEIWARGRTYKAAFGPDGARYVPFLGSNAPRNHPVRFELASVTVGGEALALEPASAGAADGAVSMDRGAVVERYVLALDSVEQTFVFEAPVAGAIELRVAFDTDLRHDGSGAMPLFECELGGVAMSEAFAVDARGARTPLTTTQDAGGYTIHAPEGVVARARFPLTIDPILSTFPVAASPVRHSAPRAALLDASDDGLIVYEEAFSLADSDVFADRVDLAGNVQPLGYVDMTTERWSSPGVAAAQSFEALLVAAAVDSGSGTDGTVMGRLYDGSTATLGAPFRIDAPGFPGPTSHVSVGGDPFDRFLVTWQRTAGPGDGDVLARVVMQDGTLLGTSNIALDGTTADYRAPSCSHHGGEIFFNDSRWAIAAERVVSGVSTIEVAEVFWTGDVAQDFYQVGALPERLERPRVSAPLETTGPKRFLVTARRVFPGDIDTQAFVVQDGAVLESDNLSLDQFDGPTFLDDEDALAVDSNGERFVVVWRDRGAALDRAVVTSLVYLDGSILATENVELGPGSVASDADVATFPATDPLDAGNHLVVWEQPTVFPDTDILAAIHDDVSTPLGSFFCAPNANSSMVAGRTYLTGSGVAGDPLTLHAVQLPAFRSGLFVCSRTSGFAFPPASDGPLCLAGAIGRFGAILDSGPSGEFSLAADTGMLPGATAFIAAVAGETWYFQAWHRDFGPGGSQRSNFTGGCEIVFR